MLLGARSAPAPRSPAERAPRGAPRAPAAAAQGGFATSGRAKVHTSTVALIPPDCAWERVQAARYAVRDRGLWRWPPHVNLLYPFAPLCDVGAHVDALARAAAEVEPFDVTLGAFRTFAHRHSATLWLDPACEPAGALDELQAALMRAAPLFDDQRSLHGGVFTPHMSIAHFPSINAARRAEEELAREWEPVAWRCTEVHVMAREGAAGQFRRVYRIPVGSGGPAGAAAALADEPPHSYPHMPAEPPEWCEHAARGRRYGARGGRRRKAKGAGPGQPPEAI